MLNLNSYQTPSIKEFELRCEGNLCTSGVQQEPLGLPGVTYQDMKEW